MLEQKLKSARRASALFQTASGDFLLREQLATDPATVIHEYVHGRTLSEATTAASNHLIYALLSDGTSLKALQSMARRYQRDDVDNQTLVNDLSSALERHADRAVVTALIRFSSTPEAEIGPAFDLIRVIIEALDQRGNLESGTENTPVTGHQPGTENTPVTGHQPGTENTPVTGHQPGTENTPVTGHQPGTENTPVTERALVTENTPITEHQPGTEHTPITEHQPGTEHTPITERVPITENTPITDHHPGTEHTPITDHHPGTEHTPITQRSLASSPDLDHLGQYQFALRSMISFAVQLRQSGILYDARMS